ncbi:MAG: cyclic nucleotide-binding domain-containing protein [Bauldia sp.]|nr:cyclic nucleotide-binding domain-containing protein [Bauldia sp.]
MVDDAGIPFLWSDVPGHVSYAIFAFSYWLTNIFWLRVTAVVGLFLEIAYFTASGGALHVGIGWDVIFILINAYQIYRLIAERRSLASLAEVQMLRQGVFAGFESTQLARILKAGAWRDIPAGTQLTEEGEPVKELILICDGQASVETGGAEIARLNNGTFVGEMAFLSGNPASATVTVRKPTRAFVFDMKRILTLAQSNDPIAGDLHRVIGLDLARKLAKTA